MDKLENLFNELMEDAEVSSNLKCTKITIKLAGSFIIGQHKDYEIFRINCSVKNYYFIDFIGSIQLYKQTKANIKNILKNIV